MFVFFPWSTNSICSFVFCPWSPIGISVFIYFERRNPPSVHFPFPPALVLNLPTADQDCENISHFVRQFFSFHHNKQTAVGEKVKCARTCKVLWLVPDDEDGLPLLQGELVFILSGVREQHQALLFYCKRCHQFIAWQSSKPQKQVPKRNPNLSFHS